MLGGSYPLDIQSLDVAGVRVIEVRGEIDTSNARSLVSTLIRIAGQETSSKPVLIDVSAAQYLDAQAVRAFEAFAGHLESQRRGFALTGSSYRVHRILGLLEVGKFIPWFDSRQAAINFLTSSGA